MPGLRPFITTATASLVAVCAATGLVMAAQGKDKGKDAEAKRPKINLRVQPQVVVAPGRATLTVELVGGADDFENAAAPSIVWEWGDDTSFESTTDCEPYEVARVGIKRRYTVQHQFRRAGNYKLYFHMKQKDRTLGPPRRTCRFSQASALTGPDRSCRARRPVMRVSVVLTAVVHVEQNLADRIGLNNPEQSNFVHTFTFPGNQMQGVCKTALGHVGRRWICGSLWM